MINKKLISRNWTDNINAYANKMKM